MYIEQNISALSTNELNWIAAIQDALEPVCTKIDDYAAYFTYSDGEVREVCDHVQEGYQGRQSYREILFVFGIYAVHELQHIYKTKNKETIIIVIEPNISFFTTALHQKNLDFFGKENIYLFVDDAIDNIITFLQPMMHDINFVKLVKQVNFYFTSYYRMYDLNLTKQLITLIRQTILSTIHTFGNDVEDSLIGLRHNLYNLPYILESKDTSKLMNSYKDVPAIVVAAGPSLNKNIKYLKGVKRKAVIIAVDTIINRLLDEGITPDFVCSIERVPQVYDYFYKDKIFPKSINLVGPAVLDSRVFETFEGNQIIPFRNEVAETEWLQRIMAQPITAGINMGSSCAHVAFGMADHLGCSPIILVGQDLAYGSNESETHASGTFYDAEEPTKEQKRDQDYVEGYYGEQVLTTRIWLQFKTWFEKRIGEANLKVIDATEGGARIYLTEQATLKQCIDIYCRNEITPVIDTLSQIETYPIEISKLQANLKQELEYYEAFLENIIDYFNRIDQMEITHKTFLKYNEQLSVVHYIVKDAMSNKIIMHNLQSTLLKYLWSHNSREQIISREHVQDERNEQIKLLGVMAKTIYEIKGVVQEAYDKLSEGD
ncbi:hypothetical protein GCM10007425_04440 [Lysinibacillus alkalisoli]|uniref:6-hydroxymethylpterin diphosphokinase MptE-like domain-containing protein n=1 Tax=Lysinibacillus alkalisoli TaxID=1911548 RepID=A0A917FXR5_9BACI|nr:6-hydroxymethylpterin diphosphokinase MptE-like protein [Lysinibacillus alkalisoli]GGG13255.1 hypothetical protein GCM10007425_04440 [Lysinibacillus alkalisoli]